MYCLKSTGPTTTAVCSALHPPHIGCLLQLPWRAALGQTETGRHRRKDSRSTSNNGNVLQQTGTAVPCHIRTFAADEVVMGSNVWLGAAWVLTNLLRTDLRGQGARAVGVLAGPIDTDMASGPCAGAAPLQVQSRPTRPSDAAIIPPPEQQQ